MKSPTEPDTPSEDALSETDMLARTIWAEARGAPQDVQIAVAMVVMNRVKSSDFPNNVAAVLQQPRQFETWRPGSPENKLIEKINESDRSYRLAQGIAVRAVSGSLNDKTGGAMHYVLCELNEALLASRGLTKTAEIGTLCFFAEQEETPVDTASGDKSGSDMHSR